MIRGAAQRDAMRRDATRRLRSPFRHLTSHLEEDPFNCTPLAAGSAAVAIVAKQIRGLRYVENYVAASAGHVLDGG